jgi:hypothetical protein
VSSQGIGPSLCGIKIFCRKMAKFFYMVTSNSHFELYKKEILMGQARGPAPTKSKTHDHSEFQLIYVRAPPRGRPKIFQNENCC